MAALSNTKQDLYNWILKIMDSVNSKTQFDVCNKLIGLFEKKFGKIKETMYLYKHLETLMVTELDK